MIELCGLIEPGVEALRSQTGAACHKRRCRRVWRPCNFTPLIIKQHVFGSLQLILAALRLVDRLDDHRPYARAQCASNAVRLDEVLSRSRDERILQLGFANSNIQACIPSPHCTALGHLSSWCRISIKALSGTGRPETAPAKSVEAVGRPARSCASCRACAEPMKVRCSSAALSISRTGECRLGPPTTRSGSRCRWRRSLRHHRYNDKFGIGIGEPRSGGRCAATAVLTIRDARPL